MALESHRFFGVVRNGKVELERGANVPDGARVTVIVEPSSESVAKPDWPEGFIKEFSGSLEGFELEEPRELPYEKREPIS